MAGGSQRYGYESYSTDWKKVIANSEVELVDVGVPNFAHADPVISAVEAGKHVLCEKPLAINLEIAREIYNVVKKSKVKTLHLLRIANGENLEVPLKPAESGIRKVTFRLKMPQASQVFLVGDFNGWDKQANPMHKDSNGSWRTILDLPIGKYEFKFVVDGEWRESLEDELSTPNKYGTFNNVVNVGET